MARFSKRRVNITDVAELAEVSIATVSKVLNQKDDHISEETRIRVQEAVQQLGYVPNDMARRLKDSSSRTLGLVIPDISNAFPEMAQGAEDEAFRRGYNLFFCSTGSNPIQEEKCLKMLVSKMVDGIIYVSSNYESGEALIHSLPVPCVAIDRQMSKQEDVGVIRIDNEKAMEDVARFITEKGCRRIGCVTADITKAPSRERYKGLVTGLESCGVPFDQKLLYTGVYSVETGYAGAMSLFEREASLDCIVCGNDMIAIGVMNVCLRLKKRIPEDIKIIGFDDIYISRYLNPELTTVKQNAYEMGQCASRMLIDYVEEGKPLSTVILPHEIVQRSSV